MVGRRTARQGLAIGALVAVAATGCGVSGGSGTGIEALVLPRGATGAFVQEAAEQTASVQTQRISVVMEVFDGDGEPLATVSTEGAFDLEAKVGEATTTVGGSGALGMDLDTEVVYDGSDVYVKAGLLEMFTGGKPWLRVPAPEVGEVADELDGSVLTDPGGFLDLLEAAGGPLEDLGTENVRGVPTRHVGVELDVQALVAEVAPERADELQAQLDRLGAVADDLESIPAEAWIDAQGYVRRFSFTVTHGGDGGADRFAGAGVTQTIELWDFDEPVDVAVPSASEVSDLDDVAGGLFGD